MVFKEKGRQAGDHRPAAPPFKFCLDAAMMCAIKGSGCGGGGIKDSALRDMALLPLRGTLAHTENNNKDVDSCGSCRLRIPI